MRLGCTGCTGYTGSCRQAVVDGGGEAQSCIERREGQRFSYFIYLVCKTGFFSFSCIISCALAFFRLMGGHERSTTGGAR
jgi:hypothetical protein